MEIGTTHKTMSLKNRIYFAIVATVLYTLTLVVFDLLSETLFYDLKSLLFQGLLFGVFFGIGFPFINEMLISKFSKNISKNIHPTLSDVEHVEIEGPANMKRGIEAAGGKLFLTNKRMIFKSHAINIQTGQTEIPYTDIVGVKKKKARLHSNGLLVDTTTKTYNLIVNDRNLWLEKITERIPRFQEGLS